MKRISAQALQAYGESILAALDVPAADAAVVVECLLHANLSGVDSHGIIRLPHYATRLSNGSITARPNCRAMLARGAAAP